MSTSRTGSSESRANTRKRGRIKIIPKQSEYEGGRIPHLGEQSLSEEDEGEQNDVAQMFGSNTTDSNTMATGTTNESIDEDQLYQEAPEIVLRFGSAWRMWWIRMEIGMQNAKFVRVILCLARHRLQQLTLQRHVKRCKANHGLSTQTQLEVSKEGSSFMFNEMMRTAIPYWQKISGATAKADRVSTYKIEKKKLEEEFQSVKKINITSDMWTSSNQKFGWCKYECFIHSTGSTVKPVKFKLEEYLVEKNYIPSEGALKIFDALAWWKENSPKYPILSQMARDLLTVPISTVVSESTFSAGGRVIEPHRCCLKPKTVEMLICGADWARALYGLKKPTKDKYKDIVIDLTSYCRYWLSSCWKVAEIDGSCYKPTSCCWTAVYLCSFNCTGIGL